MILNIAVLFDGAGLARLGLEQAGHTCTGFELNPVAHHLSKMVGSGNCVQCDVRDVDLTKYDAVWASPPCQQLSTAYHGHGKSSDFSDNMLVWSLELRKRFPNLKYLWVENVYCQGRGLNDWGKVYNAAQFLQVPIQSRNRVFGGFYPQPELFRAWKKYYDGVCPTITATEYKGHVGGKRRACSYYGRCLTVDECGYHQGFHVPWEWRSNRLPGFLPSHWKYELYKAIGNGVPVYMAKGFGVAARDKPIPPSWGV